MLPAHVVIFAIAGFIGSWAVSLLIRGVIGSPARRDRYR